MESNFEYIQRHKTGTQLEQRLARLEEQIKALREYHTRAPRRKHTLIRLLISIYEQALYAKGD